MALLGHAGLIQLSTILDVPPRLREGFPSPIDVRVFVDDLSGSVLYDPEGDPATLALVELARALLYAHGNPASLTADRLATLAPLFDVLLDQPEPLASNDMHALMTYVLRVFGERSAVRELLEAALSRRPRTMFVSIADGLIAKGKRNGLSEGLARGLARGVLGVLEHRFSFVPDSLRERISASRDAEQLQQWFDRAFVVAAAADIFDD